MINKFVIRHIPTNSFIRRVCRNRAMNTVSLVLTPDLDKASIHYYRGSADYTLSSSLGERQLFSKKERLYVSDFEVRELIYELMP